MRVVILARELPTRTTSCSAGALWGPIGTAHDSISGWSRRTLDEFARLTTLHPADELGVRFVEGVEAARFPMDPPPWLDGIPELGLRPEPRLPEGFVSGWRYTAPVVDMPVYLSYLTRRLSDAGAVLREATISSLDAPHLPADIVVNCTGHAARDLVPDPEVEPVRGQLMVVENPGVREFFAEYADEVPELTYFLPHGDRVVLGSTAEVNRLDAAPDPKIAEGILRRCSAIVPAFTGARIIEHRVGFRPARPTIRLEHEERAGRHVIHNYGHGGGGVSLSWGCADDVRAIAAGILG